MFHSAFFCFILVHLVLIIVFFGAHLLCDSGFWDLCRYLVVFFFVEVCIILNIYYLTPTIDFLFLDLWKSHLFSQMNPLELDWNVPLLTRMSRAFPVERINGRMRQNSACLDRKRKNMLFEALGSLYQLVVVASCWGAAICTRLWRRKEGTMEQRSRGPGKKEGSCPW